MPHYINLQIIFSEEKDFLTLSIEFTLADVISVILDIDGDLTEQILNQKISSQIMKDCDSKIIDVTVRLPALTHQSDLLVFMGKHLKRGIIFNVLCGSCGKQFL